MVTTEAVPASYIMMRSGEKNLARSFAHLVPPGNEGNQFLRWHSTYATQLMTPQKTAFLLFFFLIFR